ncbi:hypothetical protein [Paenibacillus kandeliae]|uniref:hypothetical protein n=1 Tax=Paenibacillus kandeliae TaxID=3231269 RepID=UPI0034576FA6
MTKGSNNIHALSPDKQFLIRQAMQELDRRYDQQVGMVWGEGEHHDTRESGHYALGLLLRGEEEDIQRASRIIDCVLDTQLTERGEIYEGTFRAAPELQAPPSGHTAWGTFSPGYGYAQQDALAEVYRRFVQYAQLEGRSDIEAGFRRAIDEVFPRVWESFDPNWREFIACTFAVILEHFEDWLPVEQVARMDEAMQRAVTTSLERYISQSIPTNTNIELMHLFIAHYYGHRYERLDWINHVEQGAAALLNDYMELHSFAEFNSSTYYGVDLTVLGMWRKYGRSDSFRMIGLQLEHGLWEDIGEFYSPTMENICGPFARSYENEITGHSSIGVLLYLALGESHHHLTGINCETSHDLLIALVGVDVPKAVLHQLRQTQEERFAYRQFKELCERDLPGHNRHVCTAKAWLSPRLMIGGMTGSYNTNGQMHHATAHWLDEQGQRYSLRMVRREVGQSWNTHLRGMAFQVETEARNLDIVAHLDANVPIELVFEIEGANLQQMQITADRWQLPGLIIQVDAQAPQPQLVQYGQRAEIVYPVQQGEQSWKQMQFRLYFM